MDGEVHKWHPNGANKHAMGTDELCFSLGYYDENGDEQTFDFCVHGTD
jgi:hypothetical protein